MGDTGQASEIPFKHGTKDCVLHWGLRLAALDGNTRRSLLAASTKGTN